MGRKIFCKSAAAGGSTLLIAPQGQVLHFFPKAGKTEVGCPFRVALRASAALRGKGLP
jgi:hypothetical protein